MIGIEEIYPLAVEFRRYFHQHPEFAMQEVETQRYIAEVLERNGIPYQKVGTGLIATVGKGEKCIAIRADMDALKVKEETGMPSRCMPFEQEHIADTCPVCGKPANKMVVWGIAY